MSKKRSPRNMIQGESLEKLKEAGVAPAGLAKELLHSLKHQVQRTSARYGVMYLFDSAEVHFLCGITEGKSPDDIESNLHEDTKKAIESGHYRVMEKVKSKQQQKEDEKRAIEAKKLDLKERAHKRVLEAKKLDLKVKLNDTTAEWKIPRDVFLLVLEFVSHDEGSYLAFLMSLTLVSKFFYQNLYLHHHSTKGSKIHQLLVKYYNVPSSIMLNVSEILNLGSQRLLCELEKLTMAKLKDIRSALDPAGNCLKNVKSSDTKAMTLVHIIDNYFCGADKASADLRVLYLGSCLNRPHLLRLMRQKKPMQMRKRSLTIKKKRKGKAPPDENTCPNCSQTAAGKCSRGMCGTCCRKQTVGEPCSRHSV